MEHELDTDRVRFEAKVKGLKPWDMRKDDRDYRVGDILYERETVYTEEEMLNEGMPLEYTGRYLYERIKFILHDHGGPLDGYCVMNTEPIKAGDARALPLPGGRNA